MIIVRLFGFEIRRSPKRKPSRRRTPEEIIARQKAKRAAWAEEELHKLAKEDQAVMLQVLSADLGREIRPTTLKDKLKAQLSERLLDIGIQKLETDPVFARKYVSAIIAQTLSATQTDHHFTAIVGYAEVPLDRQKPAPDGLLAALDILGIEEPASALYIGDHETDIICAANANRDLVAMGRDYCFVSVAAHYLNGSDSANWAVAPDYRVYRPSEISQLVNRLCVED